MKFKIEYYDPQIEDNVEEIKEFQDAVGITAEEWAIDYAYTRADKHWHKVTRIED